MLDELNEDAVARVHCGMHVVDLLEDLATLLLSKDKIDACIHYQLFLQDVFDLVDFHNLDEVNRHFKLLVVTTLDEPLGSHKGKDDHMVVLLVNTFICVGWGHLGGRTDKLTHVNSHCIKFVDQDLVYL